MQNRIVITLEEAIQGGCDISFETPPSAEEISAAILLLERVGNSRFDDLQLLGAKYKLMQRLSDVLKVIHPRIGRK